MLLQIKKLKMIYLVQDRSRRRAGFRVAPLVVQVENGEEWYRLHSLSLVHS